MAQERVITGAHLAQRKALAKRLLNEQRELVQRLERLMRANTAPVFPQYAHLDKNDPLWDDDAIEFWNWSEPTYLARKARLERIREKAVERSKRRFWADRVATEAFRDYERAIRNEEGHIADFVI